jgi:hypothetical protein
MTNEGPPRYPAAVDVPRNKSEEILARTLDQMLPGLEVGASLDVEAAEFRDAAVAFEFFVPAILRVNYGFWDRESLDGFRFAVARKTGPRSVEFLGLALLILDQSWIPMDLRVELVDRLPAVRRVKCRLGEAGGGVGGLRTVPYGAREADGLLAGLPGRRDEIRWIFEAEAGVGRPASWS